MLSIVVTSILKATPEMAFAKLWFLSIFLIFRSSNYSEMVYEVLANFVDDYLRIKCDAAGCKC